MARKREIHPGFFTNEILAGDLPIEVQVIFAGLWCQADREGRLQDRPKRLKTDVMPYRDVSMSEALKELADTGFILRYEVDGQRFIQILNWQKYQRSIHPKESQSHIPPPVINRVDLGTTLGCSKDMSSNACIPDISCSSEISCESAPAKPAARGASARKSDSSSSNARLEAILRRWNDLPDGIVGAKARVSPISKAVLRGYHRIGADKSARALFDDLDSLFDAIDSASFLHGKGFFTLDWLFMQGKSGEWNVVKLLEGRYRESSGASVIDDPLSDDARRRFVAKNSKGAP